MDLFKKLRTLLGALTHRPLAHRSPSGPEEDKGSETEHRADSAQGAAGQVSLQHKGDVAPEGGRVADLIEQQKAATERSSGLEGANPGGPADR